MAVIRGRFVVRLRLGGPFCSAAYRDSLFTGNRSVIGGFRVARTLLGVPLKQRRWPWRRRKRRKRKPDEEARKLAMIDERRAKPLQLEDIRFYNTFATGDEISAETESFPTCRRCCSSDGMPLSRTAQMNRCSTASMRDISVPTGER